MKVRYVKKETLTAVATVVGLLSIPVLVVKDRIKKIRAEEEEKKNIEKLIKNTIKIEENLNNKKVGEYIELIRYIQIPNKVICKNIIKNGYDLVKLSENVDDKLKLELRIVLESKGIRVLY
ncbi:transcription factor [Clostridium sp. ZS2-4]|uniref:transcription factor n=1 Tax=Clostridium sp. ZS2-4 TaxID=2987703 RepID=UPI00227C3E19|nr:transcription factor [Clostridium sp. ZS2-4]MCY6356544.1 transcription factor [Clostridium sp. ZS2-4]